MRTRAQVVTGFIAALLATGFCIGQECTGAERKPVWKQLDQYVAVEKRDSGSAVSDHPAALSAETVRHTLAPLQVKVAERKEFIPLFTAGELDLLVEPVQQAFAVAGPEDDVTFAVIGLHPGMLGIFKQQMVTTGRMFLRDGKINLILGQVHEPVSDRDDRRLKPFIPGSRTKPHSASPLISHKGGGNAPSVEGRPDWLVLSLTTKPPQMHAEEPPAAEKAKAGSDQQKQAPGRTIEERLLLLNDLRNKKLVTEDEYRAKRQEILGDL